MPSDFLQEPGLSQLWAGFIITYVFFAIDCQIGNLAMEKPFEKRKPRESPAEGLASELRA